MAGVPLYEEGLLVHEHLGITTDPFPYSGRDIFAVG